MERRQHRLLVCNGSEFGQLSCRNRPEQRRLERGFVLDGGENIIIPDHVLQCFENRDAILFIDRN